MQVVGSFIYQTQTLKQMKAIKCFMKIIYYSEEVGVLFRCFLIVKQVDITSSKELCRIYEQPKEYFEYNPFKGTAHICRVNIYLALGKFMVNFINDWLISVIFLALCAKS